LSSVADDPCYYAPKRKCGRISIVGRGCCEQREQDNWRHGVSQQSRPGNRSSMELNGQEADRPFGSGFGLPVALDHAPIQPQPALKSSIIFMALLVATLAYGR